MKRVLLFLVMVAGMVLFTLSCQPKQEEQQPEFYYYPQKNVYFDVEKKTYLYSLDGGNTWQTLDAQTEDEPATLGEKVVIYSDDDPVFKENAGHRKLYGGVLYNVIRGDSVVPVAATEVGERRVIKKHQTAAVEEVPEEKAKKGLRKFFDKLFHKRDKKEAEPEKKQ